MSAQIVRLSIDYGIRRFHCAICGSAVVSPKNGLEERFCEHVVVVVDWVQNVILGAAAPDGLLDAMQAANDEAADNTAAIIANILHDTAVVFELTEPGRGGGHDSAAIILAFDFFDDLEGEEVTD